MRKILIIFILSLLTISSTFAYAPTDNEIKLLSIIKQKTIEKAKIKWQLWLKREINSLEKSLMVTKNERISYLLIHIIDDKKLVLDDLIKQDLAIQAEETKKQVELQKQQEQENIKKLNDAKVLEIAYIEKNKSFFEENWKDITTDLKVNAKCTKYFDFVNDIAIKNDFPTELIIATWSIEYNCNLSNPANWYWPFQISSKYYTPWDITLEQFAVSVQDYIDFSRNKWNYFNTNTYHDYKTRFWSWNIAITYDTYTLRELRLNSILFNWIRKDTTLDKNTFANTNLNKDTAWPNDWLVTRFLKILKWRIDR